MVIIILNSVIAVIAVFANGLFIAIISWKTSLQSPSVLLLTRLAMTDVLIGIFVIPMYNVIHYYRMKGLYLCTLSKVNAYFIYLLCFCSGTGIVFISLDRFIATVFPIAYRLPRHHKKIRRALYIVWGFWAAFLVIPYVKVIDTEVFHKIVTAVILASLFIVCSCYVVIIWSVRRASSRLSDKDLKNDQNEEKAKAKRAKMRRMTATAVLIAFAFFFAYSPRFIRSIVLNATGHSLVNTYILGCWTTTVVYMNSAVNPVIYLWRLKNVRCALIKLILSSAANEENS